MKKSHVVSILNQKLVVRSDADEEYVKKVADFVEGRVQEIMDRAKSVSTLTAALLACLNVADELFQLREGNDGTIQETAQKVRNLLALIDSHLEGERQSAVAS